MKLIRRLALVAAAVFAAARLLEWMNRWGASEAELAVSHSGDELVLDPADESTMALTIRAEAATIWAYLVQIGQNRGGFYSYEWLERAFGLEISNTTSIRPELQDLAVGDRVQLVPAGWGPLPEGYALTVAQLDAPHTLVLRQQPPEHPWDGVWTFTLDEIGPGMCRLVSHTRTHRPEGLGAALSAGATVAAGTPVTWLMTRKMLRTIKELAEA